VLSQVFVLAIFQASLVGAGLVFAVYALVISIMNRMFRLRLDTVTASLGEWLTASKRFDISTNRGLNEMERSLDDTARKIAGEFRYPLHLIVGFLTTFIGYIVVTFMCVQWLVSPTPTQYVDELIAPIFVVTTFVFLLVGLLSLLDTYYITRRQFEKMMDKVADNLMDIMKKQEKTDEQTFPNSGTH